MKKRCSASPWGSLTLPLLLGTAAESASGDTGETHKGLQWLKHRESRLTFLPLHEKYKQISSHWFSCIRLTGKCHKHSDEGQQGCIRPGHLQLCVWICGEKWVMWQTTMRGGFWRSGEGAWRNIDCWTEEREGVTWASDKAEFKKQQTERGWRLIKSWCV